MNLTKWHAKKSVLNFQAFPMSRCCLVLRKLRQKFIVHFTDRHTDKQEVDIGFIQKSIPPYDMLVWIIPTILCTTVVSQSYTELSGWWHANRKSVLKFQASAMNGCWGNCDGNLLRTDTDTQGYNSIPPLIRSRCIQISLPFCGPNRSRGPWLLKLYSAILKKAYTCIWI
jgi:hypothetical protein